MELMYYVLLVVTVVTGNPCFNKILNTVPYPYNCNTFIVCWMSVPYYQACPVGSLFDISTNNCQPWPTAMCCNFVYPQSRRPLPPLPSSLPDGKLVRRILPPIQKKLPKLLPDNITTQPTKIPIQQSTTAQHLLTKLTTITEPQSNNYKITTTLKEEALPTTTFFITLGTSPDTTSNTPVTSQTLLSSESSDETIATTVFVSTSLPSTKEHLSETESTATEDGIEPLPRIPIYSPIVSALKTPVTGVTSTKQQVSKQISTGHITTKVTTSADTEIATEIPTTFSDSTTIFKETITKSPKMTSPNLQPITTTTLSHKSEEATVLSQSTLTLFNTTVSKEIIKKITEKNISLNLTKSNSKVTESMHESSSHLTDSGTKFSSVTANIPPLTLSSSNPPLSTNSAGTRIPSEETNINTSTSIGATVTTGYTSVEYTTFKVKSITDINSIGTEPNTTSKLATISASESILTPISNILARNGATIIESNTFKKSTTYKVTGVKEINSNSRDPNAASSTLAPISASESTLTPLISTLVTTPTKTNETSSESTTSKIKSITEINSNGSEPNTASSTLATISPSESTLTPLIPTLVTTFTKTNETSSGSSTSKVKSITEIYSNGSEPNTASRTLAKISASESTLTPLIPTLVTTPKKTNETSSDSTTSKVKSITEINSNGSKPNTASSILATISARKSTFTSLISTLAINAATSITVDPSVESTTYKVKSITNINTIRPEANTATSTPDTITASKTTVTPLIPTLATNGNSSITIDPSVQSTTSEVKSVTDIHTKRTEANTAKSTPDTISANKTTVTLLIPTLAKIVATSITVYPSIEPTTIKVKSITDIKTIHTEVNTAASTPSIISASKTTVTPLIPILATNGNTPITLDPSVESTTAKVNSITDINATRTVANTATSTPDTISERKTTLPPLIHTMATNRATSITSDPSIESTTYKETSLTDINSIGTELDTATSTPDTITASKKPLLPIVPPLATNGQTVKTSEMSLATTTSKVKSITDTNTTRTEPNTATSTLAAISASKITVTPLIPTLATNGATLITLDPSVESTSSKVNSITDINTTRTEANIATSTPDTISESKTTLTPLIYTMATNGATSKTSDPSVESTTYKETSLTDINSIGTELDAATGTLVTIYASKTTVIPLIPILASNTSMTSDPSVESTTYKVKSITDINTIHTEENNATRTPATITASKTTLLSIIPTSVTNGSPVKTSHISLESTTSKVKSITNINKNSTESNTATSTPDTVTASKKSLLPIMPSLATNGQTVKTSEMSLESTTPKVKSITDTNTTRTEPNTATSTPNTISASKTTVTPLIPTLATIGANSITVDLSLESTTTKVKSITDTNTIRTEANTVTSSPDIITASKTTILPIIPILATNGHTVKTSATSLESTTSKVTSFTEINSNENIIPTTVTDEYTSSFSTKRPLTLTEISTKRPINESYRSREPTTIASTGSKETTEISTTATERYLSITDLNTPAKLLESTSTKILTSTKPSVSVATFTQTSKSDIVSTKRPWKPTTSFIITDSPRSTGVTKQKKNITNSGRTLLPMPSTPNRPCPYYAALKTTEAPLETQIPDCLKNYDFVYPDLVNCHFYYKCSNGIMQRLNCRMKFGFHPHLMKCIPEESAKCGIYKSAADQKLYFTSFMLFNQIVKHLQPE